jgi:hypothetical protein
VSAWAELVADGTERSCTSMSSTIASWSTARRSQWPTKDAFAAKLVAEAAGEEQHATEWNQLRVDDPGRARL